MEPESQLDGLFAAVFEDPDARDPREALAAALVERSDPRGEFIRLQLQSTRTREDLRREARLLKTHAKAWLRPLDGALVRSSVRWDRGFPVAGRLAFKRTAAEREALVGLPSLSTLRTLDVGGGNSAHEGEWLRRFLFESPLRGLRALSGVHARLFPEFLRAQPAWSLERLAFTGMGDPRQIREIAETARDAGGLPSLVDLQLGYSYKRPDAPPDDLYYMNDPAGRYAWLWETAFGRRLRTLRVNRDPSCIVPWMPVLAKHASELETVVFVWEEEFFLQRGDAGWTRLTGKFPKDPPRHLAATLDRMIRAVRDGYTLDVEIDGYEAP